MQKGFLCFLVLVLAGFAAFSTTQKDYTVTYTEARGDVQVLKFDVTDYSVGNDLVRGGEFAVINFESPVTLDKKGYAELPYANRALQILPGKKPVIKVVGGEYEDISLTKELLPSRGVLYRDQNPALISYSVDAESRTDSWYPGELAKDCEPFILRDIRGLIISFYPFQYNAAKKILRVYKSISVEVSYTDEKTVNTLGKANTEILPVMNDVYQSLFINYNKGRFQDISLKYDDMGDLMVVYPVHFANAAQKYIAWKREKGFKVLDREVPIGFNPTNLIRDELNANPDLLYVQLFGDWLYIQCDLGGGENAPMDPVLGCVAGNDNFPDVCVGRFSCNDNNEALIQVDKTINYEKNPDMGASWYSTAIGIGSPDDAVKGDDSEADYTHIDNIKQHRLMKFTYETVHEMYIDADNPQLSSWINEGASLINYAGHGDYWSWGMPYLFYESKDVDALTNGSKLPFILALACKNGLFHLYDCFAERWLKNPNGGAIMTLMCSVIQPWAAPMIAQDYMNDIIVGGYDYSTNPGNGMNNNEQRSILGSITYNGIVMMYTEDNSEKALKTLQTWNYFGDVSLQIRTAAPKVLSVSNLSVPAYAYSSTIKADGQPVKDVIVSLSDGANNVSAMTDANGNVTLNHSFAKGTSVKLVISGFNLETKYLDVTVGDGTQPTPTPTATQTPTPTPEYVNVAVGKPAAASGEYHAMYGAANAVDGKASTVWGSAISPDTQWIYVDLGAAQVIDGVSLTWYDKYFGIEYEIYGSHDLSTWTLIHSEMNGQGGTEAVYGMTSARYVGVLLKKKNDLAYGLSEFEVLKKK